LRHRLRGLRLGVRDRVLTALAALRAAGPQVLLATSALSSEAQHGGRSHSLGADRDAIRHHYDVSNRFSELLLGPSL